MTERMSLSRRELVVRGGTGAAVVLAGALGLPACGGSGAQSGTQASGSTLRSTWGDPTGDGQLVLLAGEPLLRRTDLAAAGALHRPLGTLAHLTDAHIMDAASPARVPFLQRLGPPFQSTFRPQEALTAHVLAGMLRAIAALGPDAVIQGGDLIDNDQSNELTIALALLSGGAVRPGSGPHGYFGVQNESDPDPFYYRPAVDAPRHPGLLAAAVRSFRSGGVGRRPWLPVLGDHDILVQGEFVPFATTQGLAVGDRALWELPPGLRLPSGVHLAATSAPDAPPDPDLLLQFVSEALAGPTVRVPADPARRELSAAEVVGRLSSGSGVAASSGRLDYVRDVGKGLRLVALDLASRRGGSGGVVVPGQVSFLSGALAAASRAGRHVIVCSHQPLRVSAGGSAILDLVAASDRAIAVLAGHTHRNRIVPVPGGAGGGYWEIETASLIDWPQQSRALRVWETRDGGVAIETWMLDHVGFESVAGVSRELSYLDASGGRPGGFRGTHGDRNALLYLRR